MSVDLTNHNTSLHFSVYVWDQVLALGVTYGWKQAGTLPPEDWAEDSESREWSGGYVVNGGETVTAEDAANLADALEEALDDIPDFYAAPHKADRKADGTTRIPVGAKLSPLEALSSENISVVRGLIAFCRQGAFRIR